MKELKDTLTKVFDQFIYDSENLAINQQTMP
jgi:hypothetical protein